MATRAPYRRSEETRARIKRAIRVYPGITKSELCRVTGLGWGTISHHVRRLAAGGEILAGRRGHRLFFYPPNLASRFMFQVRLLRQPTPARIIDALRERPRTAAALSADLSLARSTIRRYLLEMEAEGLVRPAPDSGYELTHLLRLDHGPPELPHDAGQQRQPRALDE